MLNDYLDKKETFLTIAKSIFISPKTRILPKGLTHDFGQKCNVFFNCSHLKLDLEMMFNDILDNYKETFLHCKKDNFSECQKSHISKGVNPQFWSTMQFLFSIVFI